MLQFIKSQWREVSANAKWDIIKYSGAAVIATLGYIIHKLHGLPDWSFGAVLFVIAVIVFWRATRSTADSAKSARQNETQKLEIERLMGELDTTRQAQEPLPQSHPERLTVRIIRGFVTRKQNEWSTMLLLLEVKVDGPPAEVTEWRLHLKYERAARGALHIPIDSTRMRLEYCPAGDRNVYTADPMPKAVPDRGWLLFSMQQASDELFDHVFGGTFILNVIEHDGKTSTLRQPPEFWLHRADIIQWSEIGG
jgi:hypothetical protein